MPSNIVNAAVAAEDRTFWDNDGVDYPAILRAGFANLEAGEVVQGASTITQQVIKYAGLDQAGRRGGPAIRLGSAIGRAGSRCG